MSDYRKLWFSAGVVIGAAGAGLALLLTTNRGDEARRELSKWSKSLGSQSMEVAQRVPARLKETVARGRDKLTSAAMKWTERFQPDESEEGIVLTGEGESANKTTTQSS